MNCASLLTWWKRMCSFTELSKAANGVFSLLPTIPSVERSFSRHSQIHSTDRNRLTTDRAAKLVYIAYNLAHKNNENLPTNQKAK